jgi:hypothetical protein
MTDRTALPRDILRLRDQVWRRRRELRLRSPAAARRFVRRVGFCLFWPTEGVEMPNLLQAIAGNARPLTAGYDDPAIGRSWNWKDDALDKRWWYYGKLLRRRATIVSLDVLPALYALSENFGDAQDYLIEYREGRLSAEAKAVYEALLEKGPLDAVRLRKESRLSATQAKARFDRALVELQGGLKVLPVGIADAGAWHYAFIYDLVDRWFVDLPDRARPITTAQARAEIVRQYLENMIVAERRSISQALGWRPPDVEQTVGRLIEAGEINEVVLEKEARSVLSPRRYAARVARRMAGRPGNSPARGRRRGRSRR